MRSARDSSLVHAQLPPPQAGVRPALPQAHEGQAEQHHILLRQMSLEPSVGSPSAPDPAGGAPSNGLELPLLTAFPPPPRPRTAAVGTQREARSLQAGQERTASEQARSLREKSYSLSSASQPLISHVFPGLSSGLGPSLSASESKTSEAASPRRRWVCAQLEQIAVSCAREGSSPIQPALFHALSVRLQSMSDSEAEVVLARLQMVARHIEQKAREEASAVLTLQHQLPSSPASFRSGQSPATSSPRRPPLSPLAIASSVDSANSGSGRGATSANSTAATSPSRISLSPSRVLPIVPRSHSTPSSPAQLQLQQLTQQQIGQGQLTASALVHSPQTMRTHMPADVAQLPPRPHTNSQSIRAGARYLSSIVSQHESPLRSATAESSSSVAGSLSQREGTPSPRAALSADHSKSHSPSSSQQATSSMPPASPASSQRMALGLLLLLNASPGAEHSTPDGYTRTHPQKATTTLDEEKERAREQLNHPIEISSPSSTYDEATTSRRKRKLTEKASALELEARKRRMHQSSGSLFVLSGEGRAERRPTVDAQDSDLR